MFISLYRGHWQGRDQQTAIDVLTTVTERYSVLVDEVLYSGTSVPIFKRILLPPQTTLMTEVGGYSEPSVYF